MNDNFQQDIEKVSKLEKLIKADFLFRDDLVKKDKLTAIVLRIK